MQHNKLARINEDVARELSALLRDVKDPRVSAAFISVVRCEVAPDLQTCKVYLSVLGESDAKELRRGLKSASGFLRGGLGRSLNLRNTPALVFVLDDSIEHSVKIVDMLKHLEGNRTNDTTDT
ncbi:MAG: 30S ribosome-binding factor RbfA [Oscillospiraceae bacterium]|jgi:ribosome-binding factor A|nr:30S ribosome-binding factor RbfA [Oscillospiraceae bacterium]